MCVCVFLVQATGLLQQRHRNAGDIEAILDNCYLLNAVQIHKLLANFRDDADQPIKEEVLKLVYDRTLESTNDSLLEQGWHAPFERPSNHVVGLIEKFVPPYLQMDDLLAKLE